MSKPATPTIYPWLGAAQCLGQLLLIGLTVYLCTLSLAVLHTHGCTGTTPDDCRQVQLGVRLLALFVYVTAIGLALDSLSQTPMSHYYPGYREPLTAVIYLWTAIGLLGLLEWEMYAAEHARRVLRLAIYFPTASALYWAGRLGMYLGALWGFELGVLYPDQWPACPESI